MSSQKDRIFELRMPRVLQRHSSAPRQNSSLAQEDTSSPHQPHGIAQQHPTSGLQAYPQGFFRGPSGSPLHYVHYYTDGQCRSDGPVNIGVAAAVRDNTVGESFEVRGVLQHPEAHPTEMRAKLAAIVLALENAVKRRDELAPRTALLRLYIHTDSMDAVQLIKHWLELWDRPDVKDAWGGQRPHTRSCVSRGQWSICALIEGRMRGLLRCAMRSLIWRLKR